MRKSVYSVVTALLCLVPHAFGQTASTTQKALSTWNVSTPDTGPANGILAGALTPTRPITIRRVEALSLRGPLLGGTGLLSGDPLPCPVHYTLQITNGLITQDITVSNILVQPKSEQTYTDSGPVRWAFSANNRITVSVIPPKEQFPSVRCGLVGLRVTVQYETADEVGASSAKP